MDYLWFIYNKFPTVKDDLEVLSLSMSWLSLCLSLIDPSKPPANKTHQTIEVLHVWLSDEGGERKKTAAHSATFSPISSLRLNTNGRLAPVVKVKAGSLLWLSIASKTHTDEIMHRATVEKIIKSIGAWLLNMGRLNDHSSTLELRVLTTSLQHSHMV